MAIPSITELYQPIMDYMFENQDKNIPLNQITEELARVFRLTKEEANQQIPSGRDTVLRTRARWARKGLQDAGLVWSPERGIVRLTDDGKALKRSSAINFLPEIDKKYLRKLIQKRENAKSSLRKEEDTASDTHTREGEVEMGAVVNARMVHDPKTNTLYFECQSDSSLTIRVGIPHKKEITFDQLFRVYEILRDST